MLFLNRQLNVIHFMRNKLFIITLLTLFGLALGFTGCSKSGSSQAGGQVAAQKYHCPMHPTYVSDKPGDCPICNMKLVPIKEGKGSAVAKSSTTANMKLVPAKEGQGHEGHQEGGVESVPGRVAISLSPDKRQMIGLTTAVVEKRELTLPIRTTATFEHDETRLARISPRFAGWVRDLKVNFTGQKVEKGQPLFTVYSPELFSAENEYLIGYQSYVSLKNNASDAQREGARRLVESSRRKLKLWEIGDAEIQALESNTQAKDELLLRSPVSGHVVAKTAVEGKSFMAGETLYEIADLSHLWLRAYVFEFEAPLIKVGQKARVILPYLGNKTYESTVTFLYPHIEPQTRRAEIRLEVENPELELRPQMWANVELDASFGEVLAVPASAVIDTGPRYVAFVKADGDRLEPRVLKVGAKTDDYYQVLEGIKEGERVVTRALFLVDSESQLKAAISGMGEAGEHNH